MPGFSFGSKPAAGGAAKPAATFSFGGAKGAAKPAAAGATDAPTAQAKAGGGISFGAAKVRGLFRAALTL